MRLLPTLIALLLLACQAPPPEAYVKGGQATAKVSAQLAIGKNAVGEDCTQQADAGQAAEVFCGSWQQPSARIRSGGPGSAADLAQLAVASPWRTGIDNRFRCEPPVATTVLGGQPAQLLQ